MKLNELCSSLKEHKSFDFLEKEIHGITHDSRKVKDGYVFVAIKGHKLDGHSFVTAALDKGASAIVVEKKIEVTPRVPQIVVTNTRQALASISSRFYGEPSSKMTVVGITGTMAKQLLHILQSQLLRLLAIKQD